MDKKLSEFGELKRIGELCKLLNIKHSGARFLVFHRQIPFIKVGRSVFFDPSDIKAWLESKKIEASDVN
jgi:excisionase family DNA binding protein